MKAVLDRLAAHFDACAKVGEPRALWWRDDDATRAGPKLDALLRLANDAAAPLALAVIPERTAPPFLEFCERHGIDVLQHGIGHHNHEKAGKSAELGSSRPLDRVLADLLEARERLASPAFLPVLVPPWNRMREDLLPQLSANGYRGVSLFGKACDPGPPVRVDTHIDPIDWRGPRSLVPSARLETMVDDAIATSGPIGLLTHHIDHDGPIAEFVAAFAALVARHPGARWVSARALFGGAAS